MTFKVLPEAAADRINSIIEQCVRIRSAVTQPPTYIVELFAQDPENVAAA